MMHAKIINDFYEQNKLIDFSMNSLAFFAEIKKTMAPSYNISQKTTLKYSYLFLSVIINSRISSLSFKL